MAGTCRDLGDLLEAATHPSGELRPPAGVHVGSAKRQKWDGLCLLDMNFASCSCTCFCVREERR